MTTNTALDEKGRSNHAPELLRSIAEATVSVAARHPDRRGPWRFNEEELQAQAKVAQAYLSATASAGVERVGVDGDPVGSGGIADMIIGLSAYLVDYYPEDEHEGPPSFVRIYRSQLATWLAAIRSALVSTTESAPPASWVVLLNYGNGRWSGEMLTDVLPSDSSRYKIVRPLYASPPLPVREREAVIEECIAAVEEQLKDAWGTLWPVKIVSALRALRTKGAGE